MTVGSAGSTRTNSADLFVGGNDTAAGEPGNLTVEDQGLVNVGATLKIWNPGTVSLDGGSIETGTLEVVEVGDFNFNSGTLRFSANASLDSTALDQILAGTALPTLTVGQHLAVVGIATLSDGLRLDGGSLSVGSISQADL